MIELPPRCRARYQVETVLGSGGHGMVLAATDLRLGRPVALKLMHAQLAQDPDSIARFAHEAKVTAGLSHPNVARVYDHDFEDGVFWISYERLPGPDLATYFKQHGMLSVAESCSISLQVAEALTEAHARDIIHRDVKPENVVAAGGDVWKMTDFGLAKWSKSQAVATVAGVIFGTPAYLAPERILGHPPAPASDIYALGITLFELVSGKVPFQHENFMDVLKAHLEGEIPRLSGDVPTGLESIIRHALSKEPQDRPSAAEFARALMNYARAVQVPSTSPVRPGLKSLETPTVRVQNPAQKVHFPRSYRWGAVLFIALVLSVGLADLVSSKRRKRPPGTPATTQIAQQIDKLLSSTGALYAEINNEQLSRFKPREPGSPEVTPTEIYFRDHGPSTRRCIRRIVEAINWAGTLEAPAVAARSRAYAQVIFTLQDLRLLFNLNNIARESERVLDAILQRHGAELASWWAECDLPATRELLLIALPITENLPKALPVRIALDTSLKLHHAARRANLETLTRRCAELY
jgi:serine/threonine protein kinase